MPGINPGQFLSPASSGERRVHGASAVTDPREARSVERRREEWILPPSAPRAGPTCCFRQPVMVAVHADEMLAENEALDMADFTSAQGPTRRRTHQLRTPRNLPRCGGRGSRSPGASGARSRDAADGPQDEHKRKSSRNSRPPRSRPPRIRRRAKKALKAR